MDRNGRYDHIEDVLVDLHSGQWFNWSDSEDKIYENLIICDPEAQSPENKATHGIWETDKPTKDFLESELKKLQDEFDVQKYARNRIDEYPSTGDQLDMMYKDNKNSTTTHADAVEAVKTKWPKNNTGPVE